MTSCPKCRENGVYIDREGQHCLMCGWVPTRTACGLCRCLDGCGGHLEGTDKRRRVEYCENCRVKEEIA